MSENLILSLLDRLDKRDAQLSLLVNQLNASNIAQAQAVREPKYEPIRWVGSPESVCALLEAFAKASAEFEAVLKDSQGQVGKDDVDAHGNKIKGSGAKFNYADLASIVSATRPALAKNGLAILQPLALSLAEKAPLSRITTILAGHGARLEVDSDVPEGRDMKDFGGNITYMRRYGVQALLAVAGEVDADQTPDRPPMRQQTAPSVQGGQRQGNPPNRPPDTQLSRGNNQAPDQGRQQGALAANRHNGQGATSHTQPTDKQATIAGLQADINKAQATTPATTAQASAPGTGTEPQSVSTGPAEASVSTPAAEVLEYDTDAAIMPHLRDLRNLLWARDEGGTKASVDFILDTVHKPFREMNIVEANRLLRAFRAEQQRRESMDAYERQKLFEGRAS